MALRRRDVLGGGVALAVGCGGEAEPGPGWAPRTPRPADWPDALAEDPAVFDLGVASGDPRPDGAVLWTHTTASGPVTVVVVRAVGDGWEGFADLEVEPVDGFVKVTVSGLDPDQWFAFQAVDATGAASAVGYARTAPDPDADVEVTLAATSCLDASHGDFPSITAALSVGPVDALLQLGDTVYADGATTREDYRAFWATTLAFPAMRALGASSPQVHTWDDHEVANNWTEAPFDAEQLAAARAAFFENTPIGTNADAPERIWRSLRFGRTVELFVLDSRSEREPEVGRYLSDAQLQWLIAGLAASPCTWKVVQNSVPIADLPLAFDAAEIVADRWEGFPEQRTALLDAIAAAAITGVVFVSGDLHFPAILRVDPAGGAGHGMFDVLVGPGGSVPVPIALFYDEVDPWVWRDAVYNTARLVFTPDGRLRITHVGEDGRLWADVLVDTLGSVVGAALDHSV